MTLVGIALGGAEVTACPPGDSDADGAVSIDELVAAVNALLGGCPAPAAARSTWSSSRP